jgi:esterase/lipase superfamily enzyme
MVVFGYVRSLGCILATLLSLLACAHAGTHGEFDGAVEAKLSADGRSVELVEPLRYLDASGRSWSVAGGTIVESKCFPSVVDELIGAPFVGAMKNPAILYNYFCATQTRLWQDVQLMFREAMLASGVDEQRASLIYGAIERFGPRWQTAKIDPACLKPDGRPDFEKCTQNSGSGTRVTLDWPSATEADLRKFVDDVYAAAGPQDKAALQKMLESKSVAPTSSQDVAAVCLVGNVCTPVRVYFGTNRQRADLSKRIAFGPKRATQLQLGSAVVTVPRAVDRPKGQVTRPSWIERAILGIPPEGDPARHFTIPDGGVTLYASTEDFVAAMKAGVGLAAGFKDHAFIFVHGYNVSFDDALFRTAQIAYDLGDGNGPFGTAFLYSWPSAAELTAYGYDEDSARMSADYLLEFVKLVSESSGVAHVHVIAHSMGNAALLAALQKLPDQRGTTKPLIDQLILAAPDVDAGEFEKIAASINRLARQTTLYASSRDVAMQAARKFRAGAPRAGDVTIDGPTIAASVETIDISTISTDILALGHAEYADRRELLNDIGLIFRKFEHPPDARNINFQRRGSAARVFWRYAQ